MKKMLIRMIRIMVLAVILMLGGTTLHAEELQEGVFEMTTSAESLKKGDKVEVEFRVRDKNIAGVSGYLSFDTEVFEMPTTSDIKMSQEAMDMGWSKSFAEMNRKLVFLSGDGTYEKMQDDGLLATLTLTVKKDVELAEIAISTLEIDAENAYYEKDEVTLTVRDATYRGYDACEFSLRMLETNSSQIKAGDVYTVEVYVSNITQPVNGIDARIFYDEEVLELIEVEDGVVYNGEEIGGMEGMNHFEAPMYSDYEGVIHAVTDVKSDFAATSPGFQGKAVMKMWFKAKKDAQKVEITMREIAISYIATLYYTDGVSANILTIGGNAAQAQGNVALSMDNQTATSSEIVVPVKLTQNTGFNALGMTITYDNSVLVYDSLEIADAMKTKIDLESVYVPADESDIKASFIALNDISDTGEIVLLKFHKKDGVASGSEAMVKAEITQVENNAETNVTGSGAECVITIGEEQLPEEKITGDVTRDGKIDLLDAVYILQYYNQVRTLDETQMKLADVNSSGAVDLVDALLILKYYNGEINAF